MRRFYLMICSLRFQKNNRVLGSFQILSIGRVRCLPIDLKFSLSYIASNYLSFASSLKTVKAHQIMVSLDQNLNCFVKACSQQPFLLGELFLV